MDKSKLRLRALEYHSAGRPGKIAVVPTKPHNTRAALALAYTPGVAEPCLKIKHSPDEVYRYTAKGNLVGVITNGTAVLGLGNIGPLASKPVMEGKSMLFKIFADIDVFDIEINAPTASEFVDTVCNISPTFGGINLEDIKAPECFAIESALRERLAIPVMHDDQHGTAIVSAAALLNALETADKRIEEVHIVINGAGSAAVASADMYIKLGARLENIVMFDSKGVVIDTRDDLPPVKRRFATSHYYTSLAQALDGADVFVGMSTEGVLTPDMIRTMNRNPIVFALANPNPEIDYNQAVASRHDVIVATGRSDYPNQVNNVLGFPYIFRGALDTGATQINQAMQLAAVRSLAELAHRPVPQEVKELYDSPSLTFGRDYLLPKPLDKRLISTVAPAVAQAAIDSGVARGRIADWQEYCNSLEERIALHSQLCKPLNINQL